MLSILAIIGCKTDPVRGFAIGEFVVHSNGSASRADDTLSISAQGGNNFKAVRRTGFRLLHKGKPGKKQFEQENWSLIYDQATGVMTELRKGRMLVFYPDSGFLLIGKRKYLKSE